MQPDGLEDEVVTLVRDDDSGVAITATVVRDTD
jgi:hypothetical protein